MKHIPGVVRGAVFAAMVTLAPATVIAATTAAGPYYADPSWDQTMPGTTRFIVLSNFNSEAVLDRETGLVWEKTPSRKFLAGTAVSRNSAIFVCWNATTGGRLGWRVPRVEELTSLADPSNFANSPLAAGSPFVSVEGGNFWSIDFFPGNAFGSGASVFFVPPNLGGVGNPAAVSVQPTVTANILGALCVRGGSGSSINAN